MRPVTMGDLAFNLANIRYSRELKSDMQRLSRELSSGKKTDISTAVTSDLTPVARIEQSLAQLAGFDTAAAEVAHFAEVQQAALGSISDQSSRLAGSLLVAGNSGSRVMIDATVNDAEQGFRAAISALNTQAVGRYVFSGMATGTAPLADADQILTDLVTAVSGQTTAAGVVQIVEDWFDLPGGGFDTVAFQGSATHLAPFRVGRIEDIRIDVAANDQEVRNSLKGYALAALVHSGVLAADPSERAKLAVLSGEALLEGQESLAELRARVGVAEARIEQANVQNMSERSSLELARANLTAVDPFKTATQFQAVQGQLETLYTVTARMSQLRLTDFLR